MCPVHQIYNFFLTPNRGLKLPTPVTRWSKWCEFMAWEKRMALIILIALIHIASQTLTSYNGTPLINMTVNVILRGHMYQLSWNQASSLNRTSIRLTSPACTLCRYQFTKFSFADNCHSLWTTVVLYGCKYISFILLVMIQSHSLLCESNDFLGDASSLAQILSSFSSAHVLCLAWYLLLRNSSLVNCFPVYIWCIWKFHLRFQWHFM